MTTSSSYSFLLALIPILVWSFHGPLAVLAMEENSPVQLAFYSAFFGTAANFLLLHWYRHRHLAYISESPQAVQIFSYYLIRTQPAYRLYVVLAITAGIFLTGHYFLHYFSVYYGPKIEVTVIIYTNPITQMLMVKWLAQNHSSWRRITLKDNLLMFIAFFGAALIVLSTESRDMDANTYTAYSAAALASLSAGFYIAIFYRSKDYFDSFFKNAFGKVIEDEDETTSHFRTLHFIRTLFYMNFGFLLVMAVVYAWTGAELPRITLAFASIVVLIAVINVVAAEWAWLKAIARYGKSTLTSFAYFSLVFSALIFHVFFDAPVSSFTVIGITCILSANILLHGEGRQGLSTTIAYGTVLGAGAAALYTQPSQYSGNSNILEILALAVAAYSILIAFYLARLAERNRMEDETRLNVSTMLVDVLYEAKSKRTDKLVADILRDIIDINYSTQKYYIEEKTNDVRAKIRTLDCTYDGRKTTKILNQFERWILLKSSRLSLGERAVIYGLSAIIIIPVFVYRDDTMFGDIFAVIFTSGILFLNAVTREYDLNIGERKFATVLSLQQPFFWIRDRYFIPKWVHAYGELPNADYSYCYEVEPGERKAHKYAPQPKTLTYAGKFVMLVGLAIIILLIYLKHGKI